ncbi:2-isopropylmalate synthase [Aerococcus sanguinicola]|uniref:2-isopropylmalate synthase n=1 Tax=Aerococcus sanguinicola TaxID=119206 RepID=UPI0018A777B4|nr:2-isopropylmalate synthase [Aerococcus sanguinicola]
MKQIDFFDTTLRDGEQTPGVNFNTQEKVRIAKQLEEWGIDAIEAGFPISSPGDFEAVKAIADSLESTTTVGLARCREKDIDAVRDALVNAKSPSIHVFLATSPIHREYKLKMTKEEVLENIAHHVRYAKQYFESVQFSPEDATRTELDFLAEAVNTAIEAGATIINIPDTTGYTNPKEMAEIFQYLQKECPKFDEVMFSCHCHNDLGMATANALAAIENGATRVEGTINGIGERAGNTALEEVATALRIREDHYQCTSHINLEQTKRLSDLVSHLSGMPVPRNKPIIGDNAFAHESGIHQDGVLKNASTYEIITPQMVGVQTNALPLGKLSGRHAFSKRLEDLGFDLSEGDIKSAFAKFKVLADKKKQVSNEDIRYLVLGHEDEQAADYKLVSLQLMTGTNGIPSTVIQIKENKEDAEVVTGQGMGKGPIEAIFNTVDDIMQANSHLTDYRLEALTGGIDAQAEVHVAVANEDGTQYNGSGIDYDVVTASAMAYVQACGKLKADQDTKEA